MTLKKQQDQEPKSKAQQVLTRPVDIVYPGGTVRAPKDCGQGGVHVPKGSDG